MFDVVCGWAVLVRGFFFPNVWWIFPIRGFSTGVFPQGDVGSSLLKYRCMLEPPAQPCVLCGCVLCIVLLYVMLGCCGGVYVDFSGGLWLLYWIMVAAASWSMYMYMYVSGDIIKLVCTSDAAPIVM